jgi:glyoxylase-like metal-dependent hydrolase (beta-lactamase superfamily II)
VAVVRNGGKTVLCDSGTGGQVQPTAGKMMANMKAAGIDPATIDTILISHCHPDHIFGLMEKDTNKPVFPKRGDRHLRRGIQVLDRSGGHRPAA